MRRFSCLLAFGAALFASAPASAQFRNVGPGVADRTGTIARSDADQNWLYGGEVQTNFQLDMLGRRAPQRARAEGFNESLANLYVLAPYGFALNMVGRFEPAERDRTNTARLYSNETLWLDEINLTWTRGAFDVFGGKIHPRFGSAWDRGPGLYGTDFGRDYELTEKLGGGVRAWWSDLVGLTRRFGTHNIQVEGFSADTSFLSNGGFARRWRWTETRLDPETGEATERPRLSFRNSRRFGGADNVSDALGGVVVSAAGFAIPMPRGLAGYNVAYSKRRPGADANASGRGTNEGGVSAGAFWTIPLPQRLTAALFAEYTRRDDADGFRGRTREWAVAGLDLRRAPWTVSYAFQQNLNRDPSDGRQGRVQHAASVSYDLYFLAPLPLLRSTAITAGWRRLREDGLAANDFGVSLTWGYKF